MTALKCDTLSVCSLCVQCFFAFHMCVVLPHGPLQRRMCLFLAQHYYWHCNKVVVESVSVSNVLALSIVCYLLRYSSWCFVWFFNYKICCQYLSKWFKEVSTDLLYSLTVCDSKQWMCYVNICWTIIPTQLFFW